MRFIKGDYSVIIDRTSYRKNNTIVINVIIGIGGISHTLHLPNTIVPFYFTTQPPICQVILEKTVENGLVEAFGNGKGRDFILSRTVYSDTTQRVGYVLQKDIDKKRHLELIESLARENDYISKSDVVELLHVSENRAYYLIKKLMDANVLEVVQKGHYTIIASFFSNIPTLIKGKMNNEIKLQQNFA